MYMFQLTNIRVPNVTSNLVGCRNMGLVEGSPIQRPSRKRLGTSLSVVRLEVFDS